MPDNPPIRILFVDDEESIRITLPAILRMHGLEVTTCASVPEALECIQKEKFDVLLADLNIGQPGDGFTVVSAMRRVQPEAVTIIITGYPAFETALEAIRRQVDEYIVKPASIPALLKTIDLRLRGHRLHEPHTLLRIAAILRHHSQEVIDEWLTMCNGDSEIGSIPLDDLERADHVPGILNEVIEMLEQHRGVVSDAAMDAAAQHGHERRRQRYTISFLMKESRYLRRAVLTTIQRHLLDVNISFLLSDLIDLSDSLDTQVRNSVEAFLTPSAETRVA
jgi:ActR/RegA family two-component response regulator